MNRAYAVRYGPVHDSNTEKTSLIRGKTNVGRLSLRNNYNAVKDLLPHSFASHQILLSCVTNTELKTVRFLSRNIPESVINHILEYLDTQSSAVIRVIMLAESLIDSNIHEGSSDICLSKSVGSRARSAMVVLSNKLFPVNRESATVQSKDSAEIRPFKLAAQTADVENQAEGEPSCPDLSPDTVYIGDQSNGFVGVVVDSLRKCGSLFYTASGFVAILILVLVLVVYR